MKKPDLDQKSKEHIEESFASLIDSHEKGKLAFAAALKKHLKNLDPGELLEEHLPKE